MSILIEVCVDSLEGALTAQAQGADRLELCANLPIGGTTPSAGLLKLVRARVTLPIHVLIRPRGGDFLYSDGEVETMLADIETAKEMGADGIVCGALTPQGAVNAEITRRLLTASAPLPFTFHRAFDQASDAYAALHLLQDLGTARILTSGQTASPALGLPLLRRLVEQSGELIIMPGGGINPENIGDILRELPLQEIHFSGSKQVPSGMVHQDNAIPMGITPAAETRLVTDPVRLGGMIRLIREWDTP